MGWASMLHRMHVERLFFFPIALTILMLVMSDQLYLSLFSPSSLIKVSIEEKEYKANENCTHDTCKSINYTEDHFPFRYLINEPHLCANTANLYIINVVGTAPKDYTNRSRIRRLWADKKWFNMTGFMTVFMVGATSDAKQMAKVKEESSLHRDIIQVSLMDSYNNLTFKSLCMLHWVKAFCSTPVWFLKSDTDVLVNVFELSNFLRIYDKMTGYRRDHFVCKRLSPAYPCRQKCNPKWRVTWKEYPYMKYPAYCMGPGYIMPRRLVDPLYLAANKTHPFRMEDVYYTGLLPQSLKWKYYIHHLRNNFPWRPKEWSDTFSKTDLMILELDNGMGPSATTSVWLDILHYRGLMPQKQEERGNTSIYENIRTHDFIEKPASL